jgi:hypothetical protein
LAVNPSSSTTLSMAFRKTTLVQELVCLWQQIWKIWMLINSSLVIVFLQK